MKPMVNRASTTCLAGVVWILAFGCPGFAFEGKPLLPKTKSASLMEKVEISGRTSNGRIIDCGGGWFNGGKPTELIIRSEETAKGWERPEGITIRNCRIRGSIRIIGMGRNGQAPRVRDSSHKPDHTQRAQAAAPTGILISGVEIESVHGIPLYLAPGVTGVTIEKSKFTGSSSSTGIYLDAESARNVIRENTFSLQSAREIIAIDGSAENRIENNRFEQIPHGGIYLYRNSGEGGTVRHQTPHGNTITGNRFNTATLGFLSYGIWIGSRNGRSSYRHADDGFPFGSSIDDRDFANNNTLTGNTFSPPSARAIRNDGTNNHIDAKSRH